MLREKWQYLSARFVIVETKIRRNAEIKREVLRQIIVCAAGLVAEDVGDQSALRQKAEAYRNEHGSSLAGAAQAAFRVPSKDVWEDACTPAREGNPHLLNVTDVRASGAARENVAGTPMKARYSPWETALSRQLRSCAVCCGPAWSKSA